MSELERRALLGLAGAGAVAALSSAAKGGMGGGGPLNPPAGGVGSTGRTLDEVYNHIPTSATLGAYDNRTPIPGGGVAVTISQSGSYVLTGNITVNAPNAISINVSDVSLDLNGFTITQNNGAGYGIACPAVAPYSNISIRNGTVRGGDTGIAMFGTPSGILIENVVVHACGSNGVLATGIGLGIRVRGCMFSLMGGIAASPIAVLLVGNHCVIEDCTVQGYHSSATTPRGIFVSGEANLIQRCSVTCPVYTAAAIGIEGAGVGIIRDCTSIHFGTGFGYAMFVINGGGNVPL